MNSTDAAVKRFKEFYGDINRETITKFLGVSREESYRTARAALENVDWEKWAENYVTRRSLLNGMARNSFMSNVPT